MTATAKNKRYNNAQVKIPIIKNTVFILIFYVNYDLKQNNTFISFNYNCPAD
jgi:hypothetical protein